MIMTRDALIFMIYFKLLQTKVNAVDQSTAFTLMTTDVEKIVEIFWRLILKPWFCVLQIDICGYLLYRQLGTVCCVPIIVIFDKPLHIEVNWSIQVNSFAHLPVSFGLVAIAGHRVPDYQNTWFQAVEAQVNLTSHTLSSMHFVKLLELSRNMKATIQRKRKNELQLSQKFRFSNCLALTACTTLP